MKLSNDGKTLLKVSNEDIVNGTCVIPDGLTSIGNAAFYGCTSLTQMRLPDGLTSIGVGAFYNCTGLTQMSLPDGLTSIDNHAFRSCTGLQAIVINSDNDDELARIKHRLPEEHQGKVIKQSFYNNVVAFQRETHQKMLNYLGIENLTSYSDVFNGRLPVDLLKMLASFDVNINKDIEKRINALGLPTTPEAFNQNKNEVDDLLGSIPKPTANDIGSRLLCISKLQTYVDKVNGMKDKKVEKYPKFFDDNPALSTEISEKLALCQKMIEYLKGNNDLSFTQKEMDILNNKSEEGKSNFLAQTLEKFSITLPAEGPQAPHCP